MYVCMHIYIYIYIYVIYIYIYIYVPWAAATCAGLRAQPGSLTGDVCRPFPDLPTKMCCAYTFPVVDVVPTNTRAFVLATLLLPMAIRSAGVGPLAQQQGDRGRLPDHRGVVQGGAASDVCLDR